ncbi:hypothetical protein [Brevibacillus aydinogluensis]|uniref:Uncharacterized protein n=1 Tax=Brevibacillus aydinogluensis TaxID=927786 RepID=A0AA48M8J2_9BACL|nr:hypothetical protein [Brevibacillus aydinogluensis]CAJ1000982.1 hypothetical protein BSPP4475_01405 [Brevibacillus aydinogluensis]
MSEKNHEIIHDLTILYMKNSVKLADYSTPEDYARIYLENYYKIQKAFTESKSTIVADVFGKK